MIAFLALGTSFDGENNGILKEIQWHEFKLFNMDNIFSKIFITIT
jgi:hypothetical protein